MAASAEAGSRRPDLAAMAEGDGGRSTAVIWVGIDDTDVLASRGTNQLARAIAAALAVEYRCVRIVRHQLLDDPRIPYTSHNSSASIGLEPAGRLDLPRLAGMCRELMLADFIEGSDPGLCVAGDVPAAITEFGVRCQSEVVTQADACELARRHGLWLEGLGGTCGGVIGALAAVGLAATGDDGRIVQLAQWPDDLSGVVPVCRLHERDVAVCCRASGQWIDEGLVDVGKHLRPNRRWGKNVLFVEEDSGDHRPRKALKLP
ncbi:MAG: hypothetical protein ACYC6Y_01685 [Thermoguttaceae bacterium]